MYSMILVLAPVDLTIKCIGQSTIPDNQEKRTCEAHSFLHVMSKLFRRIIFSLSRHLTIEEFSKPTAKTEEMAPFYLQSFSTEESWFKHPAEL